MDGNIYDMDINEILFGFRARFESLCGSLVQMCPSLIEEVCSESGITTKAIHKVCVFKAFHRETF